eukprot:CAMPEP_0202881106 /NCGR_PEP_ID=MMETSP1391-20130828/36048_1 /ASSEMBLY_ACC=CAM_ASM_000867 /TAXON_ID=1034604 /ORGANISM="Chlamydomonas leiostraca, Strain SAG 11-49" /LENGTH=76 /DNA_ID=CAMNT_0049563731 /DNA_START=125 /DNA_END=352 /DNA_ORIENTATION=+
MLKKNRVPSSPAVTSRDASGVTATAVTGPLCGLNAAVSSSPPSNRMTDLTTPSLKPTTASEALEPTGAKQVAGWPN